MLKFIDPRLVFAWILSIAFTFFVLGFLGNFYSTFFEIILLTLLVQFLTGLLTYRLLGKAKHLRASQPFDFGSGARLVSRVDCFRVDHVWDGESVSPSV